MALPPVLCRWERKRGKKLKNKIVKELLKGTLLGIMVASMFAGIVKINAAFADTWIPEEYIRYCEEAGQKYNICPELLEAVIEEESSGNPDAVGQAGEIGLMQVYPEYHWERMGRLEVNYLFEPEGNITVGADYLAELFLEYGDVGTALMVYNGVEDAVWRGEMGYYTDYARRILKRSEQLERLHGK